MTFTHARHSTHENGSGFTLTCAVTLASAVKSSSLVFVSVGWASNPGDTCSIADDKGNNYTLVDLLRSTAAGYSWQTAYLDGITNAPITITATMIPATRQFISIVVGEYSGGLGGSSLNGHAINAQTNPATTANAVTSTNFTPTAANSLIYGSLVDASSIGAISAGTNYTLRLNNSSSSFDTEDKTLAVAAAGAATFTTSTSGASAFFVTGGLAIKPWLSMVNRAVNIQTQSNVRASFW